MYNESYYADWDDGMQPVYEIETSALAKISTERKYHNSIKLMNSDLIAFLNQNKKYKADYAEIANDSIQNTNELLNNTVGAAIGNQIPLVPSTITPRALLKEVTENHVEYFLIRRNKYVELITAQSIFEYITNGYDTDEIEIDKMSLVRIPVITREMRIRDAFRMMLDCKIPVLLISWSEEEAEKYKRIKKTVYPCTVTLAEINQKLSERLVADHVVKKKEEEDISPVKEEESTPMSESENGSKRGLLTEHRVVECEAGEVEETEEMTEEAKLKAREERKQERKQRMKDCVMRFFRMIRKALEKMLLSWVYRGLLLLLVTVDIIWSLFYILDYSTYVQTYFFLIVAWCMFIDYVLRMSVLQNELKWVRDVFDVTSIVVSSFSYYIPLEGENVKQKQAWIKTLLIVRLVRSYLFFSNQKQYVSKNIRKLFNRNRNQQTDHDLDLTYIMPRIIAMSWPGNVFESIYRNSIKDVEDYLNKQHMGHYWVINLCAESEYSVTGVKVFGGRYTHYCMYDHNTCSIDQLLMIMEQCTSWLAQDPQNVVAIHCKGGKGRTGMIIACLLMKQGSNEKPDKSLMTFASKRTMKADDQKKIKTQCVSSPSQIRYVFYYELIMKYGMQTLPEVKLVYVRVPLIGKQKKDLHNLNVEVSIFKKHFDRKKYDMKALGFKKLIEEDVELLSNGVMPVYSDEESVYALYKPEKDIFLFGDIKVVVSISGKFTDDEQFVWFNTNFLTSEENHFSQIEIDSNRSRSSSSLSSSSSSSSSTFSNLSITQSTKGPIMNQPSSRNMRKSNASLSRRPSDNDERRSSINDIMLSNTEKKEEFYIDIVFEGSHLEKREENSGKSQATLVNKRLSNTPSMRQLVNGFTSGFKIITNAVYDSGKSLANTGDVNKAATLEMRNMAQNDANLALSTSMNEESSRRNSDNIEFNDSIVEDRPVVLGNVDEESDEILLNSNEIEHSKMGNPEVKHVQN